MGGADRRICAGRVAPPGDCVRFPAMKFLHLNFLPRSTDLALLVLRVWFGLSLLVLHGWMKLANFGTLLEKFSDPVGVGRPVSLVLAVGGEVVCPALLALGLFTRIAALGHSPDLVPQVSAFVRGLAEAVRG